jgi:hypothetical protein
MPALARTGLARELGLGTALFKAFHKQLVRAEGDTRNSFSGKPLQLSRPVAGGTQVLTVIERFAPLASRYDVLLCDVWGVVHNGSLPSRRQVMH